MFSLVNVARKLDIDAEDALRQTIDKFVERFNYVEQEVNNKKKVAIEMGKDMELRVHLVKSTGHIPIYLSKLYDPEES